MKHSASVSHNDENDPPGSSSKSLFVKHIQNTLSRVPHISVIYNLNKKKKRKRKKKKRKTEKKREKKGTPKSTLTLQMGSTEKKRMITHGSNSPSQITPQKSALLTKQERDRQNAIYELIRTELKFADHLEEVKKYYHDRLSDYVGEEEFKSIFSNFMEIHSVHKALAKDLGERQGESEFIECIGDIYMKYVCDFFFFLFPFFPFSFFPFFLFSVFLL